MAHILRFGKYRYASFMSRFSNQEGAVPMKQPMRMNKRLLTQAVLLALQAGAAATVLSGKATMSARSS
jgi:hypothetical protein